jgi:hypothetical protein
MKHRDKKWGREPVSDWPWRHARVQAPPNIGKRWFWGRLKATRRSRMPPPSSDFLLVADAGVRGDRTSSQFITDAGSPRLPSPLSYLE